MLALFLGAVLGLALTWGDTSEKQQAIDFITEAKEIHELWIDKLAECKECEPETTGRFILALADDGAIPADVVKHIGSVQHHREWVERYQLVLKVLRK